MNRKISSICYYIVLIIVITSIPRTQSFAQNRCLAGLNGISNYVAVQSSTDFDLSTVGMIEMWVYPLALVGDHSMTLISKMHSAGSMEFMFNIGYDQVLEFGFATEFVEDIGGAPVPVNQWSHVAVVWQQTGSTYVVNFLVNGSQSGGPFTLPGTPTWVTNTDSIKIGGGASFGPGYNYNGYIDEVRIWSHFRSQSSIAMCRFVSIGDGPGSNPANSLTSAFDYNNLIASWTFNAADIAYDGIGGHNGYYNGTANSMQLIPGQPLPYNFALKLNGQVGDFLTVADNAAFNTSNSGTLEAWVYHVVLDTTQSIICRGITGHEFNWEISHENGNKQVLEIGSTAFINSDGPAIPRNKWIHLAVVWFINGGQYTVLFYVNGQQSGSSVTMPATWTSLSGTLLIGGWQGNLAHNWYGFLDEVRYWNTPRMVDTIRSTMFISCRNLSSSPDLVAAWNFDGNLKNHSLVSGIDASCINSQLNFARLSGYYEEILAGPVSTNYNAYPTVIDNNTTGNYIFSVHNTPIPDLGSISDSIHIDTMGTVINAEVLVSIQHPLVNDLNIRLRAPNGVSKDLCLRHGSFSLSGMLTAFDDASPSITTPYFLPPWSPSAAPDMAMGNFGSSMSNGAWTLTVEDAQSGNTGALLGWGLKLNINPIGIQPISGIIPKKFQLYQNYPNPFNPSTDIKFDIPKNANVKVRIYDILGREVASVLNEFKRAGEYSISYDASNLASGIYIYKIEANDFTDAKKMILIK